MSGYAGTVHGSLTLGDFEIAETSYRMDQRVTPHAHDRAIMVVVLAGGMVEHVGGRAVDCLAGTALYHPEGEVHAHRFHGSPSRCLTLQLGRGWLERLQVDAGLMPDGPVTGGDDVIVDAARLLRSELRRGPDALSATLDGLALRLLATLARSDGVRLERGPAWLHSVIERLRDDPADDVGLDGLAELAGVSPEHLARVFRREKHCTVGQYVRRLRVRRARWMLEVDEMPLSQVALELGFSDQSHFTRVFKAQVGCTPGAYRRSRGLAAH